MVRHIMIVAPGASEDKFAASFVREVHERFPEWYFSGVGGEAMRCAGVEVVVHYTNFNRAQNLQAVKQLPQIPSVCSRVKKRIFSTRPDVLVLIGLSASLLEMAHFAKLNGIKVLYNMSPQNTVISQRALNKLKASATHVAAAYPYAVDMFHRHKMAATYIGCELLQKKRCDITVAQAREALSLYDKKPIVGILPGNRLSEIKRVLPLMLNVAKSNPGCRFVLGLAPNISKEQIKRYKTRFRELDVWIVKEQTDLVIRASDAVICASGGATLEVALMGVPMVVIGKESKMIERFKQQGRHCLCNLVADMRIVRELHGKHARSFEICRELERLIHDHRYRDEIKKDYRLLKARLFTEKTPAYNMARLLSEIVGVEMKDESVDSGAHCTSDMV